MLVKRVGPFADAAESVGVGTPSAAVKFPSDAPPVDPSVSVTIQIINSDNTICEPNTITGGNTGVLIENSNDTLIDAFTISNTQTAINIHSATNTMIASVLLSYNTYGARIENGDNNTLAWSDFTQNTYGIYVTSSNQNQFYENNFTNNTVQAHDSGTNNWDNGEDTGNYWSDSSGIGDYAISGGTNVDHYPSNTPY